MPNASTIVSSAGGWEKVTFEDLLGMVTGIPYRSGSEDGRLLVGLRGNERDAAVAQLLRRSEGKAQVPAVIEYAQNSPSSRHAAVVSFVAAFPQLDRDLAEMLAEFIRSGGEGHRQLSCAIISRIPLAADSKELLEPLLLELQANAQAHDTKLRVAEAIASLQATAAA